MLRRLSRRLPDRRGHGCHDSEAGGHGERGVLSRLLRGLRLFGRADKVVGGNKASASMCNLVRTCLSSESTLLAAWQPVGGTALGSAGFVGNGGMDFHGSL